MASMAVATMMLFFIRFAFRGGAVLPFPDSL